MILKDVKLNWAKLLGKPRLNYNEDGYEWTVDIVVSKAHQKALMKENFGDYFKENDDGETYFKCRRNAKKPDGSENGPIEIVDSTGEPWPQNTLIGNGSRADIKFYLNELTKGKNKGKTKAALMKIKINELVPYEAGEDFDYDEPEAGASSEDEANDW